MRRTNRPYQRQNLKKQDISLDLIEKKGSLFVRVMFLNLSDYDFPKNAAIFLEAYNRLNIDHIDLGTIDCFSEKPIEKPLPSFDISQRRKINFRLKIIDMKTWRLLGLAEELKEGKYANSLLSLQIDEKIDTIFKVDCDDPDNPILIINKKLEALVKDIKPLIAETVLREILFHLLFIQESDDDSELENYKWIQLAKKYHPQSYLMDLNPDEKRQWIDTVVNEFSKKLKTINKLKKRMEKQ